MGIDASIFNALGARPRSMMDYQSEFAQNDLQNQSIQRNALALQAGQMGLADKQRATERANALAGVVGGFGEDHKRNALMLYKAGYLTEAQAYEKAQADAAKDHAEAGHKTAQTTETNIKATGARLQQYRQALDLIDNPQAAAQWLQAQFTDPLTRDTMAAMGDPQQAIARIPQDPQGFMQWRQQAAMGMEKHLAQKHAQAQLAETTRHNQRTEGISAGHLGVAQANLGLRRQELDLNRNQPKGVYDPARGVLVDPRTGQATPVTQDGKPIGPKEAAAKPLPQAVLKQITEARDNAVTIERLTSSFKPEYAGKGVLGFGGDMQMAVSGNVGADKDAVEWWKNYRKEAELVERHALFGAALTPTEQGSWRSADIAPGMHPDVVARNLKTRENLTRKVFETARQDLIDAGHSDERINAIASRGAPAAPAATAGKAKFLGFE
jgi:hypothetical protein